MGWIKRNKFFVISVILALGLLGASGFYDYQSWTRNSAAFDKLNEIYGTLRDLSSHKISAGNGKVDNIKAAKEQERQLREWMQQSQNYFQPIGRIPDPGNGSLKTEEFGKGLSRAIDQMQRDAANANVILPPDFSFSFTTDRNRLTFAPGSLEPLSAQLGEVKTISEILFAAQINALDSVQRVRVSDDDTGGPPSDYIDGPAQTNDLAVITPYQITFRAFSPEIAQVISGFENSRHGFIINGINVQRADGATDASAASMPGAMPGETPPAVAAPPGKGGLQAVFKEQLLRITIQIEIVKLTPRN
jgi:hypothetical protein